MANPCDQVKNPGPASSPQSLEPGFLLGVQLGEWESQAMTSPQRGGYSCQITHGIMIIALNSINGGKLTFRSDK